MNKNKQIELQQRLQQYDLDGVCFYNAKKALIQQGYSESEITNAAASAPFDGKVNQSKQPTDTMKFYTQNPAAAKVVAGYLVTEDVQKRQNKKRLYGFLAYITRRNFGWYSPVSLLTTLSFSDLVGFPFVKLMLFGVFLLACIYGLYTYHIVPIAAVTWFIYLYPFFMGLMMYVLYFLSEVSYWKNKSNRPKKQ